MTKSKLVAAKKMYRILRGTFKGMLVSAHWETIGSVTLELPHGYLNLGWDWVQLESKEA